MKYKIINMATREEATIELTEEQKVALESVLYSGLHFIEKVEE